MRFTLATSLLALLAASVSAQTVRDGLWMSISSFGGQVFAGGLQKKMPNSVPIGYMVLNGTTPVDAAGTTLGKTAFTAVNIARTMDTNSPFLFRLLVLGAPIQVVVRQITESDNVGATYTFSNAKLIHMDHSTGDQQIVSESLQFVFGTVQIAYTTHEGKTSQVTINQLTNTVS